MDKEIKKLIVLGVDAAMPDLIKKFVSEKKLPNFEKLMVNGVFSRVTTCFPPLTAAAWASIVTGASAGTAGIPSLMVKLPGEDLDKWHTSFDRRLQLAETLWDVGEKNKKKVALVNWPVTFPMGGIENGIQIAGALNPPFRYFYMPLWDIASSSVFSTRKLSCNQIPGRAVEIEIRNAENWENVPQTVVDCREFQIEVPPTFVKGIKYNVLMIDENGNGYNRILVSRGKDCSDLIADLKVDEMSDWILEEYECEEGTRKGRFRLQLINLSADGKDMRLYQSAINVVEGYTQPKDIQNDIETAAGNYMEVDDPWAYMDGWYELDHYIDQCGMHADWWGKATKHLVEKEDSDMVFSWVGTVDHMKHVLYGGIVPESRTFDPEKEDECWEGIYQSYKQVDDNIGRILENVDLQETMVVVVSDHGFSHLDWNPFIKTHLENEGLMDIILDHKTGDLEVNWDNTLCHPLEPCHAHIFINLKGRDPHGIVDVDDYGKIQQKIIDALYGIKDPETGETIIQAAIRKEEASTLGIMEGPGFDRIGDVLYAPKPGYMCNPFIYPSTVKYRDGTERYIKNQEGFEPAELGKNFTGVHLCLPSERDMHCVLILSNEGFSEYERKHPMDITDIAPTIANIINIPVPKDAEGGILDDIIRKTKKDN